MRRTFNTTMESILQRCIYHKMRTKPMLLHGHSSWSEAVSRPSTCTCSCGHAAVRPELESRWLCPCDLRCFSQEAHKTTLNAARVWFSRRAMLERLRRCQQLEPDKKMYSGPLCFVLHNLAAAANVETAAKARVSTSCSTTHPLRSLFSLQQRVECEGGCALHTQRAACLPNSWSK